MILTSTKLKTYIDWNWSCSQMKMLLQLHILHQCPCHISPFGHHFHFYSKSLQNCFKAWLYPLSPHPSPPLLPLGLTLITLLSSFQTKLISSIDSPLPNSMKMKVKVKSLSTVRLSATPWTYQAPPSLGFCRQEYWSRLLFPSPGDLSNPGTEPRSPTLRADTLPSKPPGKPQTQ